MSSVIEKACKRRLWSQVPYDNIFNPFINTSERSNEDPGYDLHENAKL